MIDPPDSVPISALQHVLFCERQCALIHLEQEWTENRFTAERRVLHAQAHDGPDESRPGIRVTRGLAVRSETLGLHGVCDVVEFHEEKSPVADFQFKVVPVEYKRGKPKTHRADEVQLCAQAICLEEMLTTSITEGALFYSQPRRRTVVAFDVSLRRLVGECAGRVRILLLSGKLPPATYEKRKCGACSLIDTCQPKATQSAKSWLAENLKAQTSTQSV